MPYSISTYVYLYSNNACMTYILYYILSHSNLAYALLGHCIVHHYDPSITLEKYVEDNILKPLNMTSSGFDYIRQ